MTAARAILALAVGSGSLWLADGALARRPKQDVGAEQRKAMAGLGENEPTTGAGSDDDADGAEPRGDGADGLVADTHVVKKGDTLWGICDSYFRDPWRWPKVWAQNPDITNPHWIFPGQAIKLGGITRSLPGAEGQAAAGGGAPAEGGERVGVIRGVRTVSVDNGMLREMGFVDTKTLSFAGTINGSREEKILLTTGDQAYVDFAPGQPPRPGDRFTVYTVDTDHPVREPGSSLTLGYIVRMYGDLVIDALTDRPIASATLTSVVQPVERGYKVGPVFKQFRTVNPRKNEISTTGRVIAAIEPNILIAQNMFVVLNRGSRHGVELGNRFVIIRQGDGYRPRMENWTDMDHRFPPDTIAELLAVDVREETSMAWVVRGNRDIRVGDVANLPKGY
jgi:hypothetical protein